ncbi:site-specific integrase [Deinococcus deserti]|uniref:Putative Tyrosine recombinase xerC-like protein n=1 Tax=Deinococcus deserti (strain DSM 17065 / CIP 109153 / LMG 22923 / VCD115) TaxID=546414 RepID=C1CZ59_DEIDV|nr:site-specific integrase [Deinococcus deserti]ACO45097.1 putative Tyrosine recombinase xerC-like protein [Deinococcus deserti VCD115]
MAKRANGEGYIGRRKDGSGWGGYVTLGYGPDGKQQRRYFSAKTQAEAREKLQALVSERNGGCLSSETLTLAAYLDRWLTHKQRDVKFNTHRSYEMTARVHIKPRLGKVQLDKLTPLHIEELVSALLAEGQSAKVALGCVKLLRTALTQAVRWQLVGRNVAQSVTPPKHTPKEMQVWTPDEASRFLAVAREHRLYALFYLALATGMRRGELLGLKWESINMLAGTLVVQHNLIDRVSSVTLETPKTRASRRTIALSPDTVEALRAHRHSQWLEQCKAGEKWQEHGMVFPSDVGTLMFPANLMGAFRRLCAKARVPAIRLHDLRHTSASLLIRANVPPKVVADRLGHTDPGFTLRVYAHVYEEQRRAAALPLGEMLREAGD